MMVTGGIILTRLSEEEKARLLKDSRAGHFEGHGRTMKNWILISLPDPSEIEGYLPYIKSSYEVALKTA